MAGPTVEFWQSRFLSGRTAWDRGEPSPMLLRWLSEGAVPPGRVCVPGCGSGWEVAELARRGFDVTALDYAPAAVERTRALLEHERLHACVENADVLEWSPPGPFDAIYEQTCLCAMHPDGWGEYSTRLHAWLRGGGVLLALFMQVSPPKEQEGRVVGPPYHADINGMRALFPASRWEWPGPPYPMVPHAMGTTELAVRLVRR
jgi:SAM-dependent methyltransferase